MIHQAGRHQPLFLSRLPLLASFFCFCLLLVPQPALARDLGVRSALILDQATGGVLYEQDADSLIPPASLTKVLSMYVALDAIRAGKASLDDVVTVSPLAAATGGSRMCLRPGDRVSLDKLLRGMAVSSGNDASMAVAEHISGSVERFVVTMNAKARALGMRDSRFMNPTGLPAEGQLTTARDMAVLAHSYLRRYPETLAEYHSQRVLTHRRAVTINKNPMLSSCPGADGLKTGWVCASGYNIITTAKRNSTRLVAVVLGAPTHTARAIETRRLMEAGFREAMGDRQPVAVILAGTKAYEAPVVAKAAKLGKHARMAKIKGRPVVMAKAVAPVTKAKVLRGTKPGATVQAAVVKPASRRLVVASPKGKAKLVAQPKQPNKAPAVHPGATKVGHRKSAIRCGSVKAEVRAVPRS